MDLQIVCIFFSSTVFYMVMAAGSQSNNLRAVTSTDCLCSGEIVTFECTAVGPGITLWQGSAFMNCESNNIVLLHSQFSSSMGTSGACNDGAIIGWSLTVDNDCFISQLNVTMSTELEERYVECVYDDGIHPLSVGLSKILRLTDPVPPPDRISASVSFDHPGGITFTWDEVDSSCDIVHYRVITSNCGVCSATNITTLYTRVLCTNLTTDGSICSFAVQTIVCNDVAGNVSEPIHVLLRVPDAPMGIKAIPRYSYRSGHFLGILIEFDSEMTTFNITDEIAGSTLFYTITYSDYILGSMCSSAVVPASSCNSGICRHVFDVSDSSCPAVLAYSISVAASNLIGSGYPSRVTLSIGNGTNLFVSVMFNFLYDQVTCFFIDQKLSNEKTCSISLYSSGLEFCSGFQSLIESNKQSVTTMHSNTVIIGLGSPSTKEDKYCFTLTASNETFTAIVEGVINAECNIAELGNNNISLDESDISCDLPFMSLGTKGGFVCYTGVAVGSMAVYYCSGCNFNTLKGSTVRICMENGSWSGITPQCDCSSNQIILAKILGASFTVMAVLLLIIFSVIILCVRHMKRTTKLEKSKDRKSTNELQTIYEEISHDHGLINTECNMAYATVKLN